MPWAHELGPGCFQPLPPGRVSPSESSPPPPDFEPVTAWHPMLVALLEAYLPPGYTLTPELVLTRLPQRIDIVIIQKTGEPAGKARKIHAILDYLAVHTLIEHKGPTDKLTGEDALVLTGYAAQYMRLRKVDEPADVMLMVVADRMSSAFVKRIEKMGGSFGKLDAGLWRGKILGCTLHGVATGEVHKRDRSERLLYAFSRAFLDKPGALAPLEGDEKTVYHSLYQQVEQFRRIRGEFAMKDFEELQRAFDKYQAEMMANTPVEQRLAGLTPEQRLAGLAPDQVLAGLAPEQLAELLARLPPEVLEAAAKKRSS
jgi:hypothetical protein